MELKFSREDQRFRDEVRGWLTDNIPRDKVPPHGPEKRAFDMAWQKRQYEGGWAGVSWPSEYGGRGLTITQQMIWYEEYARVGAPAPGCMFIALHHAGPTVIARGNDEQKAFHIPKILSGEANWCQGFSEPSSGSDLASIRTRGVVDGDDLVVTGQKIWTTWGNISDYQELLVRTDPNAPRHKGITWIIGDLRLPGITIQPISTMSGVQHFCQVFYDEVRIPLKNVVGGLNNGWSVAMSTLGFERGTAMVPYQMELRRLIDELCELARHVPAPDGVRMAIEDDEIASRLGELRAEIAAMRAMTYASISRAQRDPVPGPEGSMISLYWGELQKKVTRTAVDILGPAGLERTGGYGGWTQQYLAAFKDTIAGGTVEIRRNVIGERVLGLPRAKGG